MSVGTDAPLSVMRSSRFFMNDVNFEDEKWASLMTLLVSVVRLNLCEGKPPFSISLELKQKMWDFWWVAEISDVGDGDG